MNVVTADKKVTAVQMEVTAGFVRKMGGVWFSKPLIILTAVQRTSVGNRHFMTSRRNTKASQTAGQLMVKPLKRRKKIQLIHVFDLYPIQNKPGGNRY